MTRPEMVDAASAYQNGVLDSLRGAESAVPLLELAGQPELSVAYSEGLSEGDKLQRDQIKGLLYTESEG